MVAPFPKEMLNHSDDKMSTIEVIMPSPTPVVGDIRQVPRPIAGLVRMSPRNLWFGKRYMKDKGEMVNLGMKD